MANFFCSATRREKFRLPGKLESNFFQRGFIDRRGHQRRNLPRAGQTHPLLQTLQRKLRGDLGNPPGRNLRRATLMQDHAVKEPLIQFSRGERLFHNLRADSRDISQSNADDRFCVHVTISGSMTPGLRKREASIRRPARPKQSPPASPKIQPLTMSLG